MSSIVGPEDGASGSGPLRATLPMEVVTVSKKVMPVTLSLTMWLALILEIPGVATSLIGMVPMGGSRSTSTSSGVCKQAITPKEPCGGVGGCTSTNAWDGEEGLVGGWILGGETRGFIGNIVGGWLDPTFGLKVFVGWWISLAATTGQDGCNTFCHPKNFGALSSRGDSSTWGTLGMPTVARVSRLSFSAHCQAFLCHFGGLQQSPTPSGGLPKELLHNIPVGPIQPTLPPEGLNLQLWWKVSAFAVKPSGRRVYPE